MSPSILLPLLVAAGPGPDLDVQQPSPPGREAIRWDESWDRFRPWEYVATGLVLPTALSLRFFTKPPQNWEGTNGFDEAVADAITIQETGTARDAVVWTSDILFGASMAYRAVDNLAVVGAYHGNWDVALQMMMIDLEAFAVVAGVLWGTQLFVGRPRPHSANCGAPGVSEGEYGCLSSGDNNRFRSFISGHPATVIAATGVTCLHHSRMPIYGGGWKDRMACGSMIGASVATAATRLMAGSHYATDVLMGTALGVVAGWVVPSALHYGFGEDDDPEMTLDGSRRSAPPPVSVSFVPMGPQGSTGLQVVGVIF